MARMDAESCQTDIPQPNHEVGPGGNFSCFRRSGWAMSSPVPRVFSGCGGKIAKARPSAK